MPKRGPGGPRALRGLPGRRAGAGGGGAARPGDRRPAPQPRSPALRPRRAGGRALRSLGAPPRGPGAAGSAVLSRAGPSESKKERKPRGPTAAPRPGRRGVGGVPRRSLGSPAAPLRPAPRGWRRAPGRWGAPPARELLCYLESVTVFRRAAGRKADRPPASRGPGTASRACRSPSLWPWAGGGLC